jgi:hypothetical protein
MPTEKWSLLAGRNRAPLSPDEVRRATNTFLGLENTVNTRYDPNGRTVFCVSREESGQDFGEKIFGPDIFPGSSLVDPNSALGLTAAAAHELTHYYRWTDKTALPDESMEYLDEALTSLQAAMRYARQLNEHEVRQLISDAIQRLQLFIRSIAPKAESGVRQS